jgi:uncharacterized protein (UPF0332 family)
MKETTAKLMEKAARSLAAAERLTKSGDAEFAVGRAYYAMFYAAQALLNEKGLRFRRHGGVHGAFGEHFVKTGLLDQKYHRWLLEAFSKRVTGDYGVDADVSSDDARALIGQAQELLQAAKENLLKEI